MEKSSQSANSGPSFGQGLELAGIIIKAIASAVKKNKADEKQVQAVIEKPRVIFKWVENLFAQSEKNKSLILKLTSGDNELKIEALDGKKCISEGNALFKYISFNFKSLGIDRFGPATTEILVEVGIIVESAMLYNAFGCISQDFDELLLSQAQIISFCEKYYDWLYHGGYSNYFLTKMDDEYYVIVVDAQSKEMSVDVGRLCSYNAHCMKKNSRVFYPKLMSSDK